MTGEEPQEACSTDVGLQLPLGNHEQFLPVDLHSWASEVVLFCIFNSFVNACHRLTGVSTTQSHTAGSRQSRGSNSDLPTWETHPGEGPGGRDLRQRVLEGGEAALSSVSPGGGVGLLLPTGREKSIAVPVRLMGLRRIPF